MEIYNMLVPIACVMWFCGFSCFVGGWLLLGKADGKGGGFAVALGGILATITVLISMHAYATTNSVIAVGPVGVPATAALFLICPVIYGMILTSFGFHAHFGWDLRSQGWAATYMGITALFYQWYFAASAFWAVMNFTWVVALFATAAACLTKWPVGKFLGYWLWLVCGLFSLLYASLAVGMGAVW
jgi:hypothetical protein